MSLMRPNPRSGAANNINRVVGRSMLRGIGGPPTAHMGELPHMSRIHMPTSSPMHAIPGGMQSALRRLLSGAAVLFLLLYGNTASAQNNICADFHQLHTTSFSQSATAQIITAATQNDRGIVLCGGVINIVGNATTANSVTLENGTGSNCGTGTVNMGQFIGQTTAGVTTTIPIGIMNLVGPTINICIAQTQAALVDGYLTWAYAQ